MMERVVCWALAITLSVLLLVIASQQLLGPTPNTIFGLIAARSGIELFEPWMRYLTAALELIAVGLLLWPRMRAKGAALALFIAVVAIGFHLSPWLGIAVPTPEAFHAAWVANRPLLLDSGGLANDQGAMFLLALAVGVLSAANLWIERVLAHLPARTKRQAGVYAA